MPALSGPEWRERAEFTRPGAIAELEQNARTFFGSDLPALLTWRPDAVEIGAVRCPVLSIGGGASEAWFIEAREVLKQWLPHAEEATIEGGDHLVAATHPDELARLVSQFVRRHAPS